MARAPALEQLLERVLALPEAAGAAGQLLRAFRGGDRSQELVERMRAHFRRGGVFYSEDPPPALLALGWVVQAAMCEIGGPMFDRTRNSGLRWAAEALAEHERNQRPTMPCVSPNADDDPLWVSDPAGQPR